MANYSDVFRRYNGLVDFIVIKSILECTAVIIEFIRGSLHINAVELFSEKHHSKSQCFAQIKVYG